MHPEDIKAALRKQGYSQAKVARGLGVAITSVHNVIHGACKSERIAKLIADIVGVDRAILWPGRYAPADGMEAAVNRNAVLHALHQRGTNLKEWCAKEGYGYRNASNVLRGISRANFGQGKEIADKLNALVASCTKKSN